MIFKNLSPLFFAFAMFGYGSTNATIDQSHLRGVDTDRFLKEDCYRCKQRNPCSDGGDQYFNHCNPNKYIQCGAGEVCFDMDCAPGTMWDQKKLTCVHEKSPDDLGRCGSCKENPCTEEALAHGIYYHKHCSKSKKYLQCGNGVGMCYEMDCPPGTKWDRQILTCVNKKSPDNDSGACGLCKENPCTEEALAHGIYYHKHCSKSKKYLQCGSEAGMCYEKDCAPGTIWKQSKQTCVTKSKY